MVAENRLGQKCYIGLRNLSDNAQLLGLIRLKKKDSSCPLSRYVLEGYNLEIS